MNKCSGCRYVAVIDGSSHCAAQTCIKDVHITEQYEEKEQLKSELESLKRERAMLVDALQWYVDTDEVNEWQAGNDFWINGKRKAQTALSASEPQATQWLADKLSAATEELRGKLAEQQADYEEVLADHRRLVRELDVALCGDGAAKQASLCDIVGMVKDRRFVVVAQEELTAQLSAAKQEGYEQGKNDAINCYSPDDTVSDYQDKIRSLSLTTF